MIEQVTDIFDNNVIGVLATVHEDGSPRATPIHVATDGQSVYWFSKEDTVHSGNIARDSRVGLSLFSPDLSGGPKGVYLHGHAEVLDETGYTEARNSFERRFGSFPPHFEGWSAYRLLIGTLDEQKSTGGCWYFYT
jgi:general stress protein 26